jgi:nicotinate-nucleotide--dimethylbenzimidazole phosphoribosyltransferase
VTGEERLAAVVAAVASPDERVRAATRAALDAKTKPRGSLGRLEELVCVVAAIRGTATPGALAAAVVLAAADHGVAAEGVSAYPQEVTGQMVANIAAGGAAVSVLSRHAGARLVIVDCGTLAPSGLPGVLDRRAGPGTADIALGPAMSRAVAVGLIVAGAELASELAADGAGVIAVGEMGIANSTAAAALSAALLPAAPGAVCGRGTGIDAAGLERKVEIVGRALAANAGAAADAVGALAALGGFEIAFLAGVCLGAAGARVPVVLDGFITGAAALAAARIAPAVTGSMIAAHRSTEPGHRLQLDALGLAPVLDLGMRLGEGSGAALVLPIVRAGLAILADMASFDSAGVTDAGA